jgi:pimeloyl-ACP methyl ester carboxylesterase
MAELSLYEQTLRNLHTPPGMLVDVGGYRLHILTLGEGSPRVIFESGGLDSSVEWRRVFPEVAKFTRASAYDRAGVGWSEIGPEPRHALQRVNELHVLLERGDIRPPYVLAGFSDGGHTIRLFAHFFPDEVTGIVLVDARHPDLLERLPPAWNKHKKRAAFKDRWLGSLSDLGVLKIAPRALGERAMHQNIQDLPAHIQNRYLEANYFKTKLAEYKTIAESDRQARAVSDLGDIPLIVIRHGIPGPFSNLPAEQAEKAEQVWQELQLDLLNLSTRSQLRVAQDSGQHILLEQPKIVIQAIRELVAQTR